MLTAIDSLTLFFNFTKMTYSITNANLRLEYLNS